MFTPQNILPNFKKKGMNKLYFLSTNFKRIKNYSLILLPNEWALVRKQNFNGFQKIYHIHIQKTGGTSINLALLEQFSGGLLSGKESYSHLMKKTSIRPAKIRSTAFSKALLNLGFYNFGFSHTPFYKLKFPKRTYTFTVLRDPYQRIYSRFKHLKKDVKTNNINSYAEKKGEYNNLSSFEEYLDSLNSEDIIMQLSMFSKNKSVLEGIENLKKVSFVSNNENLVNLAYEIESTLGINIKISHSRRTESQLSNIEVREIVEKVRSYNTTFDTLFTLELEFYQKAQNLENK